MRNMARGTTDPGYWVSNLNYLVNQIEFVSILDNSSFRLNCLGPFDATWISFNFGHQMAPFITNLAARWSYFRSKFGHQVAPLELVPKLAIRWQHLQMLHQVASLALSHCLGLPYWHYQLVLSWYLHQPESHQLSLQNICFREPDPRDTWVR